MEKLRISYRLEGDELHSLIVQLVPRVRRPVLAASKPHEDQVRQAHRHD